MVNLKFKTITPLHISNGNELAQNLHYVIDGQYLYSLDMIRLSNYLANQSIFDFSKEYSIEDIRAIIHSRKENIAENCAKYVVDASWDFLQYLGRENIIGQTFVLEFINSNGRFYIPASSVKGALLTILHRESLGIVEERSRGEIIKPANIKDKFVIQDSDFISDEYFIVYRTGYGRPPVNFLCLDSGVEFTIPILKLGDLNLKELKQKLKEYYPNQILKARDYINKYKVGKDEAGPDVFAKLLEGILDIKLEENEYLINIGFGSGSWFKIFNDSTPPTFKNRKTKEMEEAHTSFIILAQEYMDHLGWCKLKIED